MYPALSERYKVPILLFLQGLYKESGEFHKALNLSQREITSQFD